MMAFDPTLVCILYFDDVDLEGLAWQPGPEPAAGIAQQWVTGTGATLTVFRPEPRSADDLLAADVAALLAGGTFRPGSPVREGHRLRGEITADAPAGPARLDVAAVDGRNGATRITLQRPLPEEPSHPEMRSS
jgi:hypothetical protein